MWVQKGHTYTVWLAPSDQKQLHHDRSPAVICCCTPHNRNEFCAYSSRCPELSCLYTIAEDLVEKGALKMVGYKHSSAYDSGHVAVSEIHSIYYEQYGKLDGKPGELKFT